MPSYLHIHHSLAAYSRTAAEHLRDAVCGSCLSCASDISDINRVVMSELAEAERKALMEKMGAEGLSIAHAVGETVSRVFCAAMLLPKSLAYLPPLADEASCNAELALRMEELLRTEKPSSFPFYSLHLCANKGRGAHALMLNNVCNHESSRHLLPFIFALEAHRNSLEYACSVIAHTRTTA